LRALRDLIDPKPNPVEQLCHRKAALAHHLRKRLGVRRIGTGFVLDHRSWRSVEGDQGSRVRFNKGQATSKPRAGFGERVGSGPVKNDDVCLDAESGKWFGVVRKPQRLRGDAYVARDVRVRWYEVVFAFELQSVAAQINECHSLRACRGDLGDKIPECAPQRILIKVPNPDHIETGGLKCLRDQAGVIGRCRKRSGRIIRIADDQREALLRRLGADRG